MTLPSYVDATHFHTSCRKISLSNRDFLFRIYTVVFLSFQKCKRKTIVLWVSHLFEDQGQSVHRSQSTKYERKTRRALN